LGNLRSSTSIQMYPTSRRLAQFSQGRAPGPNDTIVYVDVSWDLFHAGQIEFLKKAKSFGTFLYVGIIDDDEINKRRGSNWPIMNIHERVLCVLSCKLVDEVVISAPWKITETLIKSLNVKVVVKGKESDCRQSALDDDTYEVPRRMGILKEVDSSSHLHARELVDRILKQRQTYEKRYSSKKSQ